MKNLKAITIAIAVAFLSLVSTNSNAQNFYISAGIGYGFQAASQALGTNYSSTTSGNTFSESNANVTGSFGKGVNFGGAIGYMFSEHFGGEIGISYLSGSKISSTNNANQVSVESVAITNDASATMLRVIPALKIVGEAGKITPYARIGLVLGVSPTITANYNETDIYTSLFPIGTYDSTYSSTNKFTGGISIGFSVALGADLKLSNKVSIYGEVGMIAQTWAPTSSNYTSYFDNNIDQLPLMT